MIAVETSTMIEEKEKKKKKKKKSVMVISIGHSDIILDPQPFLLFSDQPSSSSRQGLSFLHRQPRWSRSPHPSPSVVNVDDCGAHGDGAIYDREAFAKAWKKACSSHVPVVLVVPKNKNYLLKPLFFSGPCMSDITIMIKGTIEASSNISD